MSHKPILYHSWKTRSSRVYWLCLELGIDVELKMVTLTKGENRTPEFLKLNPAGEIPVLVDGDLVIADSSAIILYLLDKHDKSGKLGGLPGSAQRAHLYRWAFYCCSRADDNVILTLLHSMVYPEAKRNPAIAAEKKKYVLDHVIPVFVEGLGKNQYFGAKHDEFTADDVVVGYILGVANMIGLLAEDRCAPLREYLGRVTSRPTFAKATTEPK